MALQQVCRDVWEAGHQQKIPMGFTLPGRMVVIRLESGEVCVYSPGPFDDETAAQVAALGPVTYLLAPNRYHHLYLLPAMERFPEAEVHGAPGLETKRSDVPFSATLGVAAPWGAELQPVPVDGFPGLSEVVFVHRPSGTLLVADLLFNLRHSAGLLATLYLRLGGAYGKVAQSRMLRLGIRDRPAHAASWLRLLRIPFDRLVPCHGDVVETGAREQVEAALAWLFKDIETPPEPDRAPAAVAPGG